MPYDEHANGRRIEIGTNEEFEITLPEIRTAGFRWSVVDGGRPVCQLLEEKSQPNTPGVGGSGHHLWKFLAASPGTCEIKLLYGRSWEQSSGPAKTFQLNVRVRP